MIVLDEIKPLEVEKGENRQLESCSQLQNMFFLVKSPCSKPTRHLRKHKELLFTAKKKAIELNLKK